MPSGQQLCLVFTGIIASGRDQDNYEVVVYYSELPYITVRLDGSYTARGSLFYSAVSYSPSRSLGVVPTALLDGLGLYL